MKALSILIVLIAVAAGTYYHERKIDNVRTNDVRTEAVVTESL